MMIDALLISAASDDAIGKAFNLGATDPLSLIETAKIMCNHAKDVQYELISFPKDRKSIDVGDFICDFSAFSNSFNWKPRISFEEGISKSIDFFKKELKYYL